MDLIAWTSFSGLWEASERFKARKTIEQAYIKQTNKKHFQFKKYIGE